MVVSGTGCTTDPFADLTGSQQTDCGKLLETLTASGVAYTVAPAAKQHLLACMSEPHRVYHRLSHLDVLWRRHTMLRAGFGEDMERLIACAIAFHDSVYEFGATDNEICSARLWMAASEDSVLSEAERTWVADTIVATADHGAVQRLMDDGARARQWVLDLDLSPLGEPSDIFDKNVAALRAEAQSLTDQEWQVSLYKTNRRFAEMQPLYKSPIIARVFAEPARRNLERQLAKTFSSAMSGGSVVQDRGRFRQPARDRGDNSEERRILRR